MEWKLGWRILGGEPERSRVGPDGLLDRQKVNAQRMLGGQTLIQAIPRPDK